MTHFESKSCAGELCGMCVREFHTNDFPTRQATHKIGEEFPSDAPAEMTFCHNLTQYVCCRHFVAVVGDAAHGQRGCP